MLMSTLECFLQETAWEERRWCALSVVKLALLTADKAVTQAANTVMQFAIGTYVQSVMQFAIGTYVQSVMQFAIGTYVCTVCDAVCHRYICMYSL